MMNIYLAGPDVFLPDAIAIGKQKAAVCARHGVRGHYPLDNAADLAAADASLAIFKGNEAMMDASDAIIANLTPFRGPSADAGTVYELGYMAGRGKFCLAYSNDPAVYLERVRRFGTVTKSADGRSTDQDGLTVVDFGWPTSGDSLVAEFIFPATVQVTAWHPGATGLAVAVVRSGQEQASLVVG